MEKLARAVESSPSAVIMTDRNGDIEYANPKFLDLSGYGETELLGRNLRLIKSGLQRPEFYEELWATISAGREWRGEFSNRRKSGELYWVSASISSIKDAAGKISSYVGVMEDITERRAAEEREKRRVEEVAALARDLARANEALRENEARYRSFFEEAPLLVWEEDFSEAKEHLESRGLAGSSDLRAFLFGEPGEIERCIGLVRVLGANKEALRRIGIADPADRPDRLSPLGFTPQALAVFAEELLALLSGATSFESEVALSDPEDRLHHYLIRLAVVPGHEEDLSRVLVALVDITTQKELEQSLIEAKEKAESANRAKSDFLAMISHEIRTPMHAIIGLTQLLRGAEPSPSQARYVDIIWTSSRLLLQIIDDILDLSKIESGKLLLERAPFDLRQSLENVMTMLAPKANEKRLLFTLDCPDAVPAWLVGDPLRLEQVLLNLCGNAIKFTERGEVELAVQVGEREGEAVELSFSVRDTGIGLDEEQRGLLFMPFGQADVSISRRFGGTGLGLAISKRIVELMDGRIGVESELGKGSRFWFTARFGLRSPTVGREGVEPEPSRRVSGPGPLAGARILLVDDNEVNLLVAGQMLELEGAVVVSARDGEAALAALAAAGFDAVLMDLGMPGMSGYEAAARIRELPGCRALPIIALTANDSGRDRAAADAAGMDDYLPKPFARAELAATLARLLASKTPRSGAAAARPSPVAALPARSLMPPLDGIDTAEGLERAMGKATLYRAMLEAFASSHREAAARATAALVRGKSAEAIFAVHATRGAAGNIGAHELFRAAGALESRLKTGPAGGEGAGSWGAGASGAATLLAEFRTQLERVLASIAAFLAARDGEAPP